MYNQIYIYNYYSICIRAENTKKYKIIVNSYNNIYT